MYWYQEKRRNVIVLPILFVVGALVMAFWLTGARSNANSTLPTVHIFSQDVALVDGVVAVHVQYGANNAPEGWLVGKWQVNAGEQIDKSLKIPSRNYARVWFRPASSTMWYLLPSQYWHGGASCQDEFGVSPRENNPSYHTSFGSAIAQWNVPQLVNLDDCPTGSVANVPQMVEVSPTATMMPEPTPVPTATPCIVLRAQNSVSSCD